MTEQEFLAQFTESIGAEPGTIGLDTELDTVEAWDSVGYLAAMTMVDESFGVALNPTRLVNAKTPGGILEMARHGA